MRLPRFILSLRQQPSSAVAAVCDRRASLNLPRPRRSQTAATASCVSFILLCVLLAAGGLARAAAPTPSSAPTNSIVWHRSTGLVDADVHGRPLWPLLEDIARQTGWHIFVEPGATRQASARFQEQPVGDALRRLLGTLNFAFVPQTNGPDFLYVFTTRMENATRPVQIVKATPPKHISNQLIVKLKPGADPDAVAKSVGAKIIGRNDKLHLYQFEFSDATATDTALGELQNNSDVVAVDYNYQYDPPPAPQLLPTTAAATPNLSLNPPTDNNPCSPIIGLIDTPVQMQDNSLDQFLLKQISVVGDSAQGSASSVQPKDTSGGAGSTAPLHGTAMYQSILFAMSQQGATTSSKILAVDVYGNNATTTSWDVALGIQAAVDGGATVLNMSLGSSGDSAVLDSVVQDAAARGILMFAAAGNQPVNTPTYPGAIPGVVAVTATQNGQLAPYADYGNFVSLALPGANAISFNNQTYGFQGTSVATALATGVAAGVKGSNCDPWSQIQATMQKKFGFTGK